MIVFDMLNHIIRQKKKYAMKVALSFVIIVFIAAQSIATQPVHTTSDFIAGYNLDYHCLILNKSLQSPDGALRDFDILNDREIATIYHEMWHAWFIEYESKRKGTLYEAMRSRVDVLYAAYPGDKRMEIYEEAVADFIDAVIETYVHVKRFLATKTPERREEIRRTTPFLKNTYERLFSERYNGYYTKCIATSSAITNASTSDTLTTETLQPEIHILDAKKVFYPFIEKAARFPLPVTYIHEAAKTIEGVVFIDLSGVGAVPPQADVVFANVYLDREDIDRVISILFEGALTRNTDVVFSEERFRLGNKDIDR